MIYIVIEKFSTDSFVVGVFDNERAAKAALDRPNRVIEKYEPKSEYIPEKPMQFPVV